MERGNRWTPNIKYLYRYAEVLDVPIEELLSKNYDWPVDNPIKRERLKAGLVLQELAAKMGLTRQRVEQIEKLHASCLSAKLCHRVANVLDISVETLLECPTTTSRVTKEKTWWDHLRGWFRDAAAVTRRIVG